jgi:glycosyltransferase involved in cell wall biosynthesis
VTTPASAPVRGLVSVVVPTFNSGAWIDETLDSVRAQSYRPIEVIVVDNGSTDDTLERVSRDPRVRVVRVAERGAGATRSAGIDAARGEFLQFLDSDDLLEPDKIERQLRLLDETGADVAWGPFWVYARPEPGAAFRKTRRVEPPIGDDVLESLLRLDGFLQLGATLIRRTPALRPIRFDNGESTPCEDQRFLFEVALAGARFARGSGDSGLLFRQHDQYRWSAVPAERFWSANRANALFVERAWRARGELTGRRIALLTDVYIAAARAFFTTNLAKFRETVAHLAELNPGYVALLPRRMRVLARVIGYPNAERVAAQYRRVKARLAGAAGARGPR